MSADPATIRIEVNGAVQTFKNVEDAQTFLDELNGERFQCQGFTGYITPRDITVYAGDLRLRIYKKEHRMCVFSTVSPVVFTNYDGTYAIHLPAK